MKAVHRLRWTALTLALLTSGCAATLRTWAEDPIYEAASEYTYARPLEELWPEVVAFMERQGYAGQADNESAERRFVSHWTEVQTGRLGQTWRRYYVEGLRLNPANCRIRIFQNDVHTGRSSGPDNGVAGLLAPDALSPTAHVQDELGGFNAAFTLVRSAQRARQLEFELLLAMEPEEAKALYAKHQRKGLF